MNNTLILRKNNRGTEDVQKQQNLNNKQSNKRITPFKVRWVASSVVYTDQNAVMSFSTSLIIVEQSMVQSHISVKSYYIYLYLVIAQKNVRQESESNDGEMSEEEVNWTGG